jgi:pyruvate,water dikinase
VSSGPARIALDLGHVEQIEPNEVLVCRVSDPSWTPFMMAAAAVVCEVGDEGSHAAIVSRELGIPCVMSVRGLLDAVRSGQIIEVDGSAGTVTVRREPTGAPA